MKERPTLTMAYLPHLDYDHQRFGPAIRARSAPCEELDVVVGSRRRGGRGRSRRVCVSEYGIRDVSRHAAHPNLALRDAGLMHARTTPDGDVLDPASRAFALVDHQIAHVYCKDEVSRAEARRVLEALPEVGAVLEGDARRDAGLDHPNGRPRAAERARRLVHLHLLARRRRPPTSPARSTSIASPATTRSRCSSTPS